MKRFPLYKSTMTALILLVLFGLGTAYADIGGNNALDRIVFIFRDNAQGWEGALRGYAISLFWILAGIEFTWTSIRLALKGADLSEFLSELVSRILFIGFFYTLLLHSSEWANAIVQSFRTAANAASGAAGGEGGLNPSDILETGINIASDVWSSLFKMNPLDGIAMVIAAIVILICFALMSASLIEALIESYIVISAGVIFMGFGGSSWTSEGAKKIIVYAVSVGAKLFVLQLIIGLGERLVREMATEFNSNNLDDILIMLGISIVFCIITRNIPNMVQGLVNGTSYGHANTLSAAISAGVAAGAAVVAGTTMGGAKGLATAVYAHKGAAALTDEQGKDLQGGSTSDAKQARDAGWTGRYFQNIKQAAIEDIGGRLSGDRRGSNMAGRMGGDMYGQVKNIQAKREKEAEKAKLASSTPVQPSPAPAPQPPNIISEG